MFLQKSVGVIAPLHPDSNGPVMCIVSDAGFRKKEENIFGNFGLLSHQQCTNVEHYVIG
jgi:hypothetical protein